MPAISFYDEIQNDPVDILRAALQFARGIAYPDLNVDTVVRQVDLLAESAISEVSPYQTILERAESLSDYLFIQHGFRGNVEEYDDPRNSYLNEVLERRLGIPISLSVVYLALASRLGIPAQGVGLPGHFIIRIPTEENDFFLDPFHGGNRLSIEDCALLVRQSTNYEGPFQQEWLKPISGHAILTRMLNNLRNAYFRREAWELAEAVIEHLRLLQPDIPDLIRDTAWIYHRRGSLRLAIQAYEKYLARAPNAPDAEIVRTHLQAAVRSLALIN
jgi:regulator of sirC expression with transglutaminase-like and TPR domain